MEHTLYIHIGIEKTGTSTIQDFIYNNKHVLEEQNVIYPSFDEQMDVDGYKKMNGEIFVNPKFRDRGLRTIKGRAERKMIYDYLHRALEKNNVLISSESLCHYISDISDITEYVKKNQDYSLFAKTGSMA